MEICQISPASGVLPRLRVQRYDNFPDWQNIKATFFKIFSNTARFTVGRVAYTLFIYTHTHTREKEETFGDMIADGYYKFFKSIFTIILSDYLTIRGLPMMFRMTFL